MRTDKKERWGETLILDFRHSRAAACLIFLLAAGQFIAPAAKGVVSAEVLVDTESEFSGIWSSGDIFYTGTITVSSNTFFDSGVFSITGDGVRGAFTISVAGYTSPIGYFYPAGNYGAIGDSYNGDYFRVVGEMDNNSVWNGTFSITTTTSVPETGSTLWMLGTAVGTTFAGRRLSKKRKVGIQKD